MGDDEAAIKASLYIEAVTKADETGRTLIKIVQDSAEIYLEGLEATRRKLHSEAQMVRDSKMSEARRQCSEQMAKLQEKLDLDLAAISSDYEAAVLSLESKLAVDENTIKASRGQQTDKISIAVHEFIQGLDGADQEDLSKVIKSVGSEISRRVYKV